MKRKEVSDIVKKHKIKHIILIHEQQAFKDKLLTDFDLPSDILSIRYSKKRVETSSLCKAFKLRFKKTLVIAEYFNYIPRILTLLTSSIGLCVLYGVLPENKLNKPKSKFRLVNLVFCPFYSDYFIVINRNQTYNKFKNAFVDKKISFINVKRKELDKSKVSYSVWISQCFAEDGLYDVEKFQNWCISLISKKNNLIVIKHPRDAEEKHKNSRKVLASLSEGLKYFEKNGKPETIYGISSSALLELYDYGCNVVRIENEIFNYWGHNEDFLGIKSITEKDLINL